MALEDAELSKSSVAELRLPVVDALRQNSVVELHKPAASGADASPFLDLPTLNDAELEDAGEVGRHRYHSLILIPSVGHLSCENESKVTQSESPCVGEGGANPLLGALGP